MKIIMYGKLEFANTVLGEELNSGSLRADSQKLKKDMRACQTDVVVNTVVVVIIIVDILSSLPIQIGQCIFSLTNTFILRD